MTPERIERFWSKVDKTEGCWLWTAGRFKSGGYGAFSSAPGKAARAHRVSYELLVGEIEPCVHLHHICEEPLCVNPKHLEVVTPRIHSKLHRPPKTHCPHGHELAGDNLIVRKDGSRSCRECQHNHHRRRSLDPAWRARQAERARRWRKSLPECEERVA